jgi:hypothetical protein
MAQERITKIEVSIRTVEGTDTGTDGAVYLGMGGREFLLDTAYDDYEPPTGTHVSDEFVLGESGNVLNAAGNDPRSPQLHVADLDRFPSYIRFKPVSGSDDWHVESVGVLVTGETHRYRYQALPGPDRLILGDKYGLFAYLAQPADV